jgi:hypothetical protein
MKHLISLVVGSFLVVSLAGAARANQDKAPAKADSAKAAGKEVTLTGTFGCAKCSFKDKDAKQCQNVLKVKEAGKEVTYEVAKNDVAQAKHEAICHNPGKPATVKGTVSEEGGKKVVTASDIKLD